MTKYWKMKFLTTSEAIITRPGDVVEIKVPAEPGDVLEVILGKMWDKLAEEGKDPTRCVPYTDPEQIEE